MNHITPLLVLTAGIAGTTLGGLGLFLYRGSFGLVDLNLAPGAALGLNTLLSLLFFLQHSGMVRTAFRHRWRHLIPEHYQGVYYAMVSGLVLGCFLILWQPAPIFYRIVGPARLTMRILFVAAIAGFVWSVRALRAFDPLGFEPARGARHRKVDRPRPFVVRGPYRWVRHPQYLLALVLIWTCPDVSIDRLWFNLLWSGWIVLGARWEEKELVASIGRPYRAYRLGVPLLVPRHWRPAYPEDTEIRDG